MAEDEALVRRAVSGEAAAFEEIVRMHQQAVYRVMLGLVGNHLDADDLTQEAFIRAHGALAGFRGESSLKTWLTRIAVNRAHDLLRRRRVLGLLGLGGLGRREVALQNEAAPVENGPEEELLSRERARKVAAFAAEHLSERERAVFTLRFAGGHSLEEIAAICGANVSTVKTHLYRALAKARRLLAEEGEGAR